MCVVLVKIIMIDVRSVVRCEIVFYVFFFFQAEDGIRDLVRSRGLGDVYKRQSRKCIYRWHCAAMVSL